VQGKVLTQYSTHANMIADTIRAAFAKTKIGDYSVEMTAPEDSTKGGLLALQHVILKPATGMALVVGTVNAGDKRAELRSYAHVAKVQEERFKRPLSFDAPAYALFLEKAGSVLGAFGIETNVNDVPHDNAPSFAEELKPKKSRAPLYVGIALVLVTVIGLWLTALRH